MSKPKCGLHNRQYTQVVFLKVCGVSCLTSLVFVRSDGVFIFSDLMRNDVLTLYEVMADGFVALCKFAESVNG